MTLIKLVTSVKLLNTVIAVIIIIIIQSTVKMIVLDETIES